VDRSAAAPAPLVVSAEEMTAGVLVATRKRHRPAQVEEDAAPRREVHPVAHRAAPGTVAAVVVDLHPLVRVKARTSQRGVVISVVARALRVLAASIQVYLPRVVVCAPEFAVVVHEVTLPL